MNQDIVELQRILDRIKAGKNSIYRNKALSHGNDMLVYLKVMQMEDFPMNPRSPGAQPMYGASQPLTDLSKVKCICPPGQMLATCPVHG